MPARSERIRHRLRRRLPLPTLLALVVMAMSCREGDDESSDSGDTILSPTRPTSPPPASPATAAPGNTVIMPPSGQITTSANTPSTGERRLLTPEEQARALNLMMNRLAEGQAKGLGDGSVTVHGAWQYDGYSYLAPNPQAAIPARQRSLHQRAHRRFVIGLFDRHLLGEVLRLGQAIAGQCGMNDAIEKTEKGHPQFAADILHPLGGQPLGEFATVTACDGHHLVQGVRSGKAVTKL